MRGLLFVGLALVASVLCQSPVDSYISTESPIAKANLLANIGSTGSRSQGALPGVVIASPSTSNPNYLYTWVRDSSLVFKFIVDQIVSGADASLQSLVDQFVSSQAAIQQVSNPSGTVSTGGLGEPKFNIDQTAFTGAWGRPQRDGPALRASTLIRYASYLLATGNNSYVTTTLWPIIKLDLDYVSNYWNQSTFDLWEEVSSSSFFTTAAQHRALREGSALATTLGQNSVVTSYTSQANNLMCFLQSYWNPTSGYVTANTGGGRSGIDANTVLSSIHSFDPNAGCDVITFQPCSDKALSNLKVYVDSFRSVYPINNGLSPSSAVATGRYKEDIYYNGNPWYLATFAVAEQLYDALIVWSQQGSLEVTNVSLAFFRQFSPAVQIGTYASSSPTYLTLTTAIKTFADGFISINAKNTPLDGSLSEQYSKSDGSPTSAVHLSWSYASALTVFAARGGYMPPSWGANGLTVPTTCLSNSGPTVQVTFNVNATTVLGENIYLTGSVAALQNWSPSNALLLSSANYPIWTITVTLPANTIVQYKYIRKNGNSITWASDPNWSIQTPATGTSTTNDIWR